MVANLYPATLRQLLWQLLDDIPQLTLPKVSLIEREKKSNFTLKHFSFSNALGDTVYGYLLLPNGIDYPALAVLAIFSVMWRWNDFLWPLIVLSRNDLFTLQVGLNAFQGELQIQWHYVLAMTAVTLLPITLVFAFLQRFITTGIATTGLK